MMSLRHLLLAEEEELILFGDDHDAPCDGMRDSPVTTLPESKDDLGRAEERLTSTLFHPIRNGMKSVVGNEVEDDEWIRMLRELDGSHNRLSPLSACSLLIPDDEDDDDVDEGDSRKDNSSDHDDKDSVVSTTSASSWSSSFTQTSCNSQTSSVVDCLTTSDSWRRDMMMIMREPSRMKLVVGEDDDEEEEEKEREAARRCSYKNLSRKVSCLSFADELDEPQQESTASTASSSLTSTSSRNRTRSQSDQSINRSEDSLPVRFQDKDKGKGVDALTHGQAARDPPLTGWSFSENELRDDCHIQETDLMQSDSEDELSNDDEIIILEAKTNNGGHEPGTSTTMDFSERHGEGDLAVDTSLRRSFRRQVSWAMLPSGVLTSENPTPPRAKSCSGLHLAIAGAAAGKLVLEQNDQNDNQDEQKAEEDPCTEAAKAQVGTGEVPSQVPSQRRSFCSSSQLVKEQECAVATQSCDRSRSSSSAGLCRHCGTVRTHGTQSGLPLTIPGISYKGFCLQCHVGTEALEAWIQNSITNPGTQPPLVKAGGDAEQVLLDSKKDDPATKEIASVTSAMDQACQRMYQFAVIEANRRSFVKEWMAFRKSIQVAAYGLKLAQQAFLQYLLSLDPLTSRNDSFPALFSDNTADEETGSAIPSGTAEQMGNSSAPPQFVEVCLDSIDTIMAEHRDNAWVQGEALTTLWTVATAMADQSMFKTSTVRAVLQAMHRHKGSALVQMGGCGVLLALVERKAFPALSFLLDAEEQRIRPAEGVLSALWNTLHKHTNSKDVNVQTYHDSIPIAKAVVVGNCQNGNSSNTAEESETTLSEVSKSMVQVGTDAMRKHRNHVCENCQVVEMALRALHCLARAVATTPKIRRLGSGPEAASSRRLQRGRMLGVQEERCGARTFSSVSAASDSLCVSHLRDFKAPGVKRGGFLSVLCDCMTAFPESAQVQELGLQLLMDLVPNLPRCPEPQADNNDSSASHVGEGAASILPTSEITKAVATTLMNHSKNVGLIKMSAHLLSEVTERRVEGQTQERATVVDNHDCCRSVFLRFLRVPDCSPPGATENCIEKCANNDDGSGKENTTSPFMVNIAWAERQCLRQSQEETQQPAKDDGGAYIVPAQYVERIDCFQRNGMCTSCSKVRTHDIHSGLPITVEGLVFRGICLQCNSGKGPGLQQHDRGLDRYAADQALSSFPVQLPVDVNSEWICQEPVQGSKTSTHTDTKHRSWGPLSTVARGISYGRSKIRGTVRRGGLKVRKSRVKRFGRGREVSTPQCSQQGSPVCSNEEVLCDSGNPSSSSTFAKEGEVVRRVGSSTSQEFSHVLRRNGSSRRTHFIMSTHDDIPVIDACGNILIGQEKLQYCARRGLCTRCGEVKTHCTNHRFFRSASRRSSLSSATMISTGRPLTVKGLVYKGHCLQCHDLQDVQQKLGDVSSSGSAQRTETTNFKIQR